MERIEQKIAGLKAKLSAARELVNLCGSSVPGTLVLSMLTLPKEIAELETKAKQLMGSD